MPNLDDEPSKHNASVLVPQKKPFLNQWHEKIEAAKPLFHSWWGRAEPPPCPGHPANSPPTIHRPMDQVDPFSLISLQNFGKKQLV